MSSTTSSSSFAIRGAVQSYAWGKVGDSSAVAQLHALHESISPSSPYAELWLGTHHKAPAVLPSSGATLRDVVGDLPYLFKVLSVAKALSIQAHPDKKLAEELHAARPEVYRDPNHKPEMACALTPFQALCGFRPLGQVAAYVEAVPELRVVAGEDVSEAFVRVVREHEAAQDEASVAALREALVRLFAAVMKCDVEVVQAQCKALAERLEAGGEAAELPKFESKDARKDLDVRELVLRLSVQYPGDVGVFVPFLLNAFELQPGEAIFLGPNEPHAYLDGDCVECMACSDNVVRAGLTPKLRDVDTLVGMLTYRCNYPDIMRGEQLDASTRVYRPPIDEFCLSLTELAADAGKYTLPAADTGRPAIVLGWQGAGKVQVGDATETVQRGSAVVVQPGQEAIIECTSEDETLILYRCY